MTRPNFVVTGARDGAWLTADRVRSYATVLLIFEILFMLFYAAGTHGLFAPLAEPVTTDFLSLYAAGMVADSATPALAYDHAAHFAAQRQVLPGVGYNYFYYPPVYLLLCAPLARLPYLVAFLVQQVLGLLPGVALVRRILGRAVPLVVLLAFPAIDWAIGTGQNAMLTAALLAGATLMVDRRPVVAGLLFGALCYKPHLGLLLPVALAAGGHWRAFAAAAVAAVALVLASIAVFGWATWAAFLTAAEGAGPIYSSWSIVLSGLTSPYGLTLTLGGSTTIAIWLQAAAILVSAAAVAVVWYRRASLPVRAAILLAAIPIAVPIFMFYDLVLLGVVIAWLLRAGWDQGFPAWQKTGLFVLFALPLWSGNISALETLVPPATAVLAMILSLRQAWQERLLAEPSRPARPVRMPSALAEGVWQR